MIKIRLSTVRNGSRTCNKFDRIHIIREICKYLHKHVSPVYSGSVLKTHDGVDFHGQLGKWNVKEIQVGNQKNSLHKPDYEVFLNVTVIDYPELEEFFLLKYNG